MSIGTKVLFLSPVTNCLCLLFVCDMLIVAKKKLSLEVCTQYCMSLEVTRAGSFCQDLRYEVKTLFHSPQTA